MIATVAYRILSKALIRGAVCMTGVAAVDGIPMTDLRGQLPERTDIHYATRPESHVQGMVWHHTATRGQSLRTIAEYHTAQKGWPAIAYHFAIGWDGHIYQMHDATVTSYNTQGYNRKVIAVVLVGNYDEIRPSWEMVQSMVVLDRWLRDRYALRFTWTHRETKATECPGRYAVQVLDTMLYGPRP